MSASNYDSAASPAERQAWIEADAAAGSPRAKAVARGRTRGQTTRVKAQATTRITARFTVALPPCRHKHTSPEEELGCSISRLTTTADAIGGGIAANMFGINERLMQLGASDVMEWEVE